MTAEPHAAPLRSLRLLPGDTEGDTSASAAPGTEGDTDLALPGTGVVPLSPRERAGRAGRHWAVTAAEGAGQLWLHPGRVLHALWHGKPESMAEHRAYVKSRAWVPQELSGKWASVIAVAGITYHLAIARPVKAVARIVDAAAERPLRLILLAAFISVLVLIVPHL